MRKKQLKVLIILFIFTINIVGFTYMLGQPTFHSSPGSYFLPIAQDYETNSTNTAIDVVNATIEQGYKNESTVALDQNANSFTAPAPNGTNYDSSYMRISVNEISVENHTLEIEEETQDGYQTMADSAPWVTSFEVPTSCYMTNASFDVRFTGSGFPENVSVVLYNATWDGTNSRVKPHGNYVPHKILGNISIGSFGWKTIIFDDLSDTYLNNSETYGNTWFIGLYDGLDGATPLFGTQWYYSVDSFEVDETQSYFWDVTDWDLVDDAGSVDLEARIGLSLNNSNPYPTLFNLTVNSTSVSNNTQLPTNNSGIWESYTSLSGSNNRMNFTTHADWYEYSFEVNQTIINYTSTFEATTTYTVESGVNVYWNATSEIDKFDHRLVNNTINFSIPLSWTTPLSSLERDSSTVSTYSTNVYSSNKIITIRGADAIDGNWTLLTTSSNLLSNIDIGVEGFESTFAYTNEVLGFNATFSTPITGWVNISIYHPTQDDEMIFTNKTELLIESDFVDLSTFDIDVENLTTIADYGSYRVQVRWNNDSDVGILDSNIVIAAPTFRTILTPPDPDHEALTTDSAYNVRFQYFDEFKAINVTGATIGSNVSGSWSSEIQNNPDESYHVTIDPSDLVYSTPGNYEIEITLNKTYYMNFTFTYQFSIVQETQVYRIFDDSTLTVKRGENATMIINYNLTSDESPIINGLITEVSIDAGLIWSYSDDGGGNYTLEIDTSLVDANDGPFTCDFNITRIGYQTTLFTFDIIVTLAQTSISLNSQTDIVSRHSGENATIYFHVEDITNSMDLTGMLDSDFYVYNDSTSEIWDRPTFDWEMWEISNGDYGVNISLEDLDYGTQTVRLNASSAPNYNYSILVTSFYIRGNYTDITIEQYDNGNSQLLPFVNDSYQIYMDASDLGLILNLNDTEYGYNYISDDNGDFEYWAWYNGTQALTTNIIYDRNIDKNHGTIDLTGLSAGDGNITLIIGQKNYENATITFNITLLETIPISITNINLPTILTQNNQTVVRFRVTYMNGTLQPLTNALITLSSNRSDFVDISNTTDANGYVEFTITAPEGKYDAMTFYVTYDGSGYGFSGGSETYIVSVSRARAISEWILYGVLAVVGFSLAVVAVQQGIVKPRKKKYRELLYNTVAVFEDAINLQHVLIIHKNTGTCVFFKTFGILDIDPDLISGFLSAAQSFVKESMSADGISEIKSGNNHLLISDGELVRVTLVLAKGASQFLRSNTARLVMLFENQYYQELIDWRGSLNIFQDAGSLIDETLHTSVILPHQITTSIKILKSVKSTLAQKLLKIARELTTAQRSFFFIAQLVSEAKDKLKKKPPEILLALNELLDNEAISAVDLSGYDEQPISEQEMNLLAQRVMQLPDLTNQERESLVKDLVRMNAAEREAALTSIQQGQKITSDVSHRMITTKMFTSKKDAKAEIKRLLKEADKMAKQKRYGDAVLCFETASVTASNWKMPEDSKKFRDRALNAQIASFNNKIRQGKKEVPKLIRQGEDERALNYCEEAYEAASSMFKLGFTEYEKTVKKFGGMLQDARKKLKNFDSSAEKIFKDDKKHFEKMERDLLRKGIKAEKEKNYNEAVSTYSELTVIANKIFKFGVISAKDKIKKYKTKVLKLKRKALKAAEEGISNLNEDELLDQKSQFLNIALEAEQGQDYLRSIVAYEEAIKIQHRLGDSEGATKLEEKIHSIVTNIPHVDRVLTDMLHRATTHFDQQTYDLAFTEFQYALGICKALGNQEQVIEISVKLDEISRLL